MPVPGSYLLTGNYQQRSGAAVGPLPVGGVGVVVGADDEVQSVCLCGRRQLVGTALAVGVNSVQVQVSAVPTGAVDRRGRKRFRCRFRCRAPRVPK